MKHYSPNLVGLIEPYFEAPKINLYEIFDSIMTISRPYDFK